MTYVPPKYNDMKWGGIEDAAVAWQCETWEIERWVAEGRIVGFLKRADAGWILPITKYGREFIARLKHEDMLAGDARHRLEATHAE
ncbi:hypothetical protein LCGC14_0772200 [marine sediment metagenome]|uniref:Uncharacterized protein n=1 Tax=marine sediment metagenome TaxID=412755 RepID=A0A0F9QHU0_9ZZZZ